jgi:hypothetical protein
MRKSNHTHPALVPILILGLLVALSGETNAQNAPPVRNDKTKATFNDSNTKGWEWVAGKCSDPTTDACAQAAIVEVSVECGASAKFFKKDTKIWQWISFSMVVASASFTAVGASTTISNAKVFSTLGGTTGLGAVTSTVNANVAGDQTGLATVNTALGNFLKYVQTGGTNNQPPANDLVYKSAPLYAAQCSAAANGSSGTSK